MKQNVWLSLNSAKQAYDQIFTTVFNQVVLETQKH